MHCEAYAIENTGSGTRHLRSKFFSRFNARVYRLFREFEARHLFLHLFTAISILRAHAGIAALTGCKFWKCGRKQPPGNHALVKSPPESGFFTETQRVIARNFSRSNTAPGDSGSGARKDEPYDYSFKKTIPINIGGESGNLRRSVPSFFSIRRGRSDASGRPGSVH